MKLKIAWATAKKWLVRGFYHFLLKKMACVALLPYLSEIMITRSVIIWHLNWILQFLVSARMQVA
jgi:hypothetical protein